MTAMHFISDTIAFALLTLFSLCAVNGQCIGDGKQCDVAKYCKYTFNNFNCQMPIPGKAASFKECVLDAGCPSGSKCINQLCCDVSALNGDSSACPTGPELARCCFERNLGADVGQPGSFILEKPTAPCGCPSLQ
ncbi:uncharacterized protein SPPG_09308 [Spizellomyces punctatus DAOM BR117]|uniref:Uncharacterized protein n=1 Tax=Spizellomyces punctatus (strain DAOM BR117) TaxID=645134 RepID=A0A0L0HCA9_SPIPD|nr:uncharacterized protein SPPG_09308 [Spizellomyces punctatus DAOM BR117]KNC98827.1 hypothetical protein SPPG_09308 [Spizellomyces punctatus DAOM BR117]|eukprot:XP_016606867.1 hypothetical protein SPPG_09308 [Spizellomyces punctatus DAOM BR117]